MKVAAIQLVSVADIDANLARCEALLSRAADAGAELVVFPENAFTYGAPLTEVAKRQDEIREIAANWARQRQLWLVAGSLPWLDAGGAPNPSASTFVFDDQGREVLRYRKRHLFDADVKDATGAYRESDSYSAGDSIGVFSSPRGKFGVAICYDLRFPEYFRALVEKGVLGVFVPSAFTYVTGEAHWEILVRARAIENQIFVVAANQGGQHSAGRLTWGESMIVDPWGRVIQKCGLGEALLFADLDFEEQAEIRLKMPVLKHRTL